MPGPWLLLAVALTLTLAGVPGGHTQPDAAQQEAAEMAERPGLDDVLRQAQRLLLLQEDLRPLRADRAEAESESSLFQPNWLMKRQHPGKREEEAAEGADEEEEEEEEEEGFAVGPHKRQHPGRREEASAWARGGTQQKRQHPGRRASWLGYIVSKRQHPGRRLVDPKAGGWDEDEEVAEEGGGEPLPEKRQHPGKRALQGPCGPWQACSQARLLLGLLGDLSGARGAEEKRQHPGRRAAEQREPLAQ